MRITPNRTKEKGTRTTNDPLQAVLQIRIGIRSEYRSFVNPDPHMLIGIGEHRGKRCYDLRHQFII